jgi:hypothetical protein
MKWIADNTGRFPQRPHYEPQELDQECERLISEFLTKRHGRVTLPIPTEELEVLIEQNVEDLDPYADLASEKGDPEGVTDFFPGRKPRVRISNRLAEQSRSENRRRTTLAHEYAHVKLHAPLYDVGPPPTLFGEAETRPTPKCHRDTILGKRTRDWLEWQAGYASGALLIPASHLHRALDEARPDIQLYGATPTNSSRGRDLILRVVETFEVSQEAARVRLEQLGLLYSGRLAQSISRP